MALESFFASFQLIFNVSFGIYLVIVSKTVILKKWTLGELSLPEKILEGEGFLYPLPIEPQIGSD